MPALVERSAAARHRARGSESADYTLAADALAPSRARRLVRMTCRDHDWNATAADNAARVIGALVAVAVRHTRAPVTLRVAASDESLSAHVRTPVAATDTSTGDLDRLVWQAVRRLSSSWGYSVTDTERDLWADFRLADRARTSTHASSHATQRSEASS